MNGAFLNRIGTACPENDIHAPFIEFAATLLPDGKLRTVFARMAERAGIARRFSVLPAGNIAAGEVDATGFYQRGAFPGTAARMALYERESLKLALRAVDALGIAVERSRITHLVVASCTGFVAPGLDLLLARALGLAATVQRTLIGFMGCAAAVPALRVARDAVRSDPRARVLVVNLELCTLHLQETGNLETALSFLIFGDGAAASLVTADPAGLALEDFHSALVPESHEFITWRIGDAGFEMFLSGQVPGAIATTLRAALGDDGPGGLLRGEGTGAVELWAVHAGGRSVLDAVEAGLSLPKHALDASRAVLHDHGNMSSATVLFVLQRMLRDAAPGARGLALAFGPGMVADSFRFRRVG